MTRIVICGGPRTGKTTLANEMFSGAAPGFESAGLIASVRYTDDLIGKLEWGEDSAEVARWFDSLGPWIIEGVTTVRALRKWHANHYGERPPVDCVILLTTPYEPLSKGQATMAKSIENMFRDIEPWLREHSVEIEER
jgi:broad-specificity NMP kinase